MRLDLKIIVHCDLFHKVGLLIQIPVEVHHLLRHWLEKLSLNYRVIDELRWHPIQRPGHVLHSSALFARLVGSLEHSLDLSAQSLVVLVTSSWCLLCAFRWTAESKGTDLCPIQRLSRKLKKRQKKKKLILKGNKRNIKTKSLLVVCPV